MASLNFISSFVFFLLIDEDVFKERKLLKIDASGIPKNTFIVFYTKRTKLFIFDCFFVILPIFLSMRHVARAMVEIESYGSLMLDQRQTCRQTD